MSRTPGSVLPTFEDATIVVAAIATAAASMIIVPGGRGLAGAGLACLMIAIAAVDARRFIIPDELTAAALALGLADLPAQRSNPKAATQNIEKPYYFGFVLKVVQLQIAA
jgi:prepilin signal peptidase PulO-like enzyme (type II secretory pathway)